ncbi:unnamed protein product, partial [Brenthis ino]
MSLDEGVLVKRTLNFTEIGKKLGFTVQQFDVVTQDGYILKLFHIPGNRNKPVLLMHGIIDSSDTFIIREKSSLAIALANSGYDVWLGNNRGNRYSRHHVYLNPDRDDKFWDFSFHELGYYDLPAIIDFILNKTGQKKLTAIGHSQGNAIFLVLGATRPEYNDKIKLLISLSPVCFLNNLMDAPYLLLKSVPTLSNVMTLLGQEEFMGDNTTFIRVFREICGTENSYSLCAHGILFPMAGSDPEELEPEFLPTIIAHYPTGTSKKNAIHLSQVGIQGLFSEFDYNWRNMDIYNSTMPPEYNLSKVTMRVALVAGRNDKLSTLKDVDLLNRKLPNVVEYLIIKRRKFSHLDAVWGRNMDKYLFPHIFKILAKYS